MTEATPRLSLPYLAPGQAQNEATHNEALAIADALIQPAAAAIRQDPPLNPEPGAAWIVGSQPTGAWSGRANAIAWWTDGGWRFARAVDGMAVWLTGTTETARFVNGGWQAGIAQCRRVDIGGVQVVGGRLPAIPAPGGGATTDAEARTALAAILVALRTHGLIAS